MHRVLILMFAVLASVFSGAGGYASPQTFVDGLVPAVWIGAVFVAIGAVAALAIPSRAQQATPASEDAARRAAAGGQLTAEPVRVD